MNMRYGASDDAIMRFCRERGERLYKRGDTAGAAEYFFRAAIAKGRKSGSHIVRI